jgi:nucleoside diphosphate kinase
MKTGILTILPYTVAARYFFSTTGIWFGTLLAYLVISPMALLAWKLTNSKREVGSEIGSTGPQSQTPTQIRGVLRAESFDELQHPTTG